MNVWILSYARSGSSFLGDMLTNTGLIGEFTERFNRAGELVKEVFGVEDLIQVKEDYRREVLFWRIANQRFELPKANKVLRRQFSFFGFVDSDKAVIDAFLPGLKYIHLKRDDIYARTVSEYFRKNAKKSTGQQFASINDRDVFNRFMDLKIAFDEKDMLNTYRYLKEYDHTGWECYLGSAPYLGVEFEDLIRNPIRTLNEILDFIGADYSKIDLAEVYENSKTFCTKRPETDEYIHRLKRLVEKREPVKTTVSDISA